MPDDATFAILERLGRIEGKLDAHVAAVNERLDHGANAIHDHEGRLRLLEATRWRAQGMTALVSALTSGGVATLLVYLLARH